MSDNHAVSFFDNQFQKQVSEQSFALNPFEAAALPHLTGSVLDMGCGLGNMSIEVAWRGASVVAVDASPTAIARIQQVATEEKLALRVDSSRGGLHRQLRHQVPHGPRQRGRR